MMFLKILQNSQENTCARVLILIKLQAWRRYFPVNFAKFLRTPFNDGMNIIIQRKAQSDRDNFQVTSTTVLNGLSFQMLQKC